MRRPCIAQMATLASAHYDRGSIALFDDDRHMFSSASLAAYSSIMNLISRYCMLFGPNVDNALRSEDCSCAVR